MKTLMQANKTLDGNEHDSDVLYMKESLSKRNYWSHVCVLEAESYASPIPRSRDLWAGRRGLSGRPEEITDFYSQCVSACKTSFNIPMSDIISSTKELL